MRSTANRKPAYFDWHIDYGRDPSDPAQEPRKITLSLQLSDAASYDGCDLEVRAAHLVDVAPRQRGALVAFRANALHRVTPITRGDCADPSLLGRRGRSIADMSAWRWAITPTAQISGYKVIPGFAHAGISVNEVVPASACGDCFGEETCQIRRALLQVRNKTDGVLRAYDRAAAAARMS